MLYKIRRFLRIPAYNFGNAQIICNGINLAEIKSNFKIF